RFPRWFWIGIGLTSISAFFAGGHPELHLAGVRIGLGGLDKWARFTVLVLLLLSLTMVIGWTTRNGDVAPALAGLLSPLRWLRVPVDEAAVVTALGVRCMPLLLDEIRTLYAARKLRDPVPPETFRAALAEVNDLLVTALVTSARRAQEMADAIEARGGVGTVDPSRPGFAVREVAALLITVLAVAGVILL
ncbi:MAG TPA: energy-coupling factor transporter transmembrane component T, partial [Acidimicrobiales bacterium]|nr:energy-coupling factor transporter transmembrane component T [Acidimicrobiales bacterium]